MPKIIIRADVPGGDADTATLTERVVAANIESPHYVTQLIERLVWAVSDAESLELTARRGRPPAAPTRRVGAGYDLAGVRSMGLARAS